jgi:hypothetical protein
LLPVSLVEALYSGLALKDIATLLLTESEHIAVEIVHSGSGDSICVKNQVPRLGVFHRSDGKKLGCIGVGLCDRRLLGSNAVC